MKRTRNDKSACVVLYGPLNHGMCISTLDLGEQPTLLLKGALEAEFGGQMSSWKKRKAHKIPAKILGILRQSWNRPGITFKG